MSYQAAWPWVQASSCPCGWAGFHWHWGEGRFRSAGELPDAELVAFDRAARPVEGTS